MTGWRPLDLEAVHHHALVDLVERTARKPIVLKGVQEGSGWIQDEEDWEVGWEELYAVHGLIETTDGGTTWSVTEDGERWLAEQVAARSEGKVWPWVTIYR